jgi:hypothetical protein
MMWCFKASTAAACPWAPRALPLQFRPRHAHVAGVQGSDCCAPPACCIESRRRAPPLASCHLPLALPPNQQQRLQTADHLAPALRPCSLVLAPLTLSGPPQVVDCDNPDHGRDDWDACPFAHAGEVVTRRPPQTHLPKLCPKARRACRKGR